MKLISNKLTTVIVIASSLFTISAGAQVMPDIADFNHIQDYEDAFTYADSTIGGNGGNSFDDIGGIKAEEPWIKPTRIEVRAGARIDQLKMTYGYQESTDEFSTEHGGSGGSLEEIIYIKNDEFIKSVNICTTKGDTSKGRIGRMTFNISNGSTITQTQTYGKTCKGSTTYTASDSYHIIGFKGRSGTEVDQLRPIYAPRLLIRSAVVIGTPLYESPEVHASYFGINLNNSATISTSSVEYEQVEGYTAETHWNHTNTFNLGFSIATSVSLGMPAGSVSSTMTLSTSFTDSFQWGKSSTENQSTSSTLTHNYSTAPYKVSRGSVIVTKTEARAPLNIQYTNTLTGHVYDAEGEVSRYSSWGVIQTTEEFGEFVDGVISVYPHLSSHLVYSCYDGKTVAQALSCPIQ